MNKSEDKNNKPTSQKVILIKRETMADNSIKLIRTSEDDLDVSRSDCLFCLKGEINYVGQQWAGNILGAISCVEELNGEIF